MVKGVTRQVVVVKGTNPALFDQAIFLVKDEVLQKGGVSEDALLKQAQQSCKHVHSPAPWFQRLLWCAVGFAICACIWLLTVLL